MPETSQRDLKRYGWVYLAGLLAVGCIAYFSSPESKLFSRGVLLCLGFALLAILSGTAVFRLLDGRISDALVNGISVFLGGLVFFPAARYIHDNLSWVFQPGAGPYSFRLHAFTLFVSALVFVVGRMLHRN